MYKHLSQSQFLEFETVDPINEIDIFGESNINFIISQQVRSQ